MWRRDKGYVVRLQMPRLCGVMDQSGAASIAACCDRSALESLFVIACCVPLMLSTNMVLFMWVPGLELLTQERNKGLWP